jgi:hypothetical protein
MAMSVFQMEMDHAGAQVTKQISKFLEIILCIWAQFLSFKKLRK